MARLGRGGFLAVAVIFHLVYLYSIFDIYFVSPVVHGMQAFRVDRTPPNKAPADRLVLYVGDGLRADKAFQSFPDPSPEDPNNFDPTPRPLAPFIRSKVLSEGTFGVSHTRVPTESRPGHVALIAGLYEDVSAVATGWKLNPVHFDSVFNRSRHTWSWGSPDILPMFKEGAVPGKIYADTYPAEFEDYSQDATQLDTWVFDRVKALFASARLNATVDATLRQDQVVFFLHLLGLDTTGHSYRPYSKEYLHNIKVVDQGVKEITNLINDFYGDGRTAYVFTADHGMSDWGSHGDGHPDNTRTPLVAWGSGVAKPVVKKSGVAAGHEDGFSHDWGFNHVRRHDVEQADVAALMAYLAGVEFPVNSVGKLPLSYLSSDSQDQALAAFVNAQEVLEMYKVKERRKAVTTINYKPYPPFTTANNSVHERVQTIQSKLDHQQYDAAVDFSSDLLHHSIQGLRYLQTYDWLFLRAVITLGYLGYITFALTTVIDLHVLHGATEAKRTFNSTALFSSILVVLYLLLLLEKSRWTYYLYVAFPVAFWEEVWTKRQAIFTGGKILFDHVKGVSGSIAFAIQLVMFVGILQALVQSYFHRIIFTICYIIGAFWPLLYGRDFLTKHKSLILAWVAGCLMLSTFTLLPVIKVENANTISAGGLLMFGAGLIYLVFEQDIMLKSISSFGKVTALDGISRSIMGAQLGVIILSIAVTRSSVASLQAKQGLPLGNQIIGWISLIASVVLPFAHRLSPNNYYLHRLVVIFLTFSPSFVLLTISYEGLFYFAFCTTLMTWVRLEHAIYLHTASTSYTTAIPATRTITSTTPPPTLLSMPPASKPSAKTYRTLTLPDFRISLFTLFLLQSAFFSTGNIASISSFSLDAVYRLIPIFDPFSQGALLMFKIMVPFAVISANLGILNRRLGLQSSALFMIVMGIGDVMTLNFFWMVRDEGSWLDIGTTISHFVIGSLLCVFVAGLEGLSEVLIGGIEVDDGANDSFKGRKEREGGVEVVNAVNGAAAARASGVNGSANGLVEGGAKSRGKKKVDFDRAHERPVID